MFCKTKDFYLKHRLIINLALVGLLFLLGTFFRPLAWIPFVFVAVLCVFDSVSMDMSYLMFCLPYLTMLMPKSAILFVVCFSIVIVKMFIITFFIKKRNFKVWEIIAIAVVAVYLSLPIGGYNRNFYLKILLIVGLLFGLSLVSKKAIEIDFKQCLRVLGISLIISALMALLKYVLPGYAESFDKIHRFTAMFDNTNTLAITCEISLGFLMCLFAREKKWFDAVLIALVAVVGCFTFSKTYFIMLMILSLCLFCCFIKSHTKQTLIIAAIGLTLIGLAWLIFPESINYLLNRFSGLGSKDFATFMNKITTGRYTLWHDYIKYLIDNPVKLIFGCGLGAGRASFSSPHNIFISTLYQLGLVGIGLLVFAVVMILKSGARNDGKKKFNFAIIIPILSLVLVGLVEDMIMFIAIV